MANFRWPRRLVIIRHGQSLQNVALDLLQENLEEVLQRQKLVRDADIDLSPVGIRQSLETGEYLGTTPPFDICFTSPYKRTRETAKNITSNLGYELRIFEDFRLREKEFGRLHGFSTAEIKEKYPEEFIDRERDGKFYYRLPRGENYPDVMDRIHSFMDKLHRDYAGKSVLVVTHQVPYLMFRALFQHLNERQILDLGEVPNCAIEEFAIDTTKRPEGRMKLQAYNKVAYQP